MARRPGQGRQGPPRGTRRRTAATVTVEERQVGRTRFDRLDVDAAAVVSQPALVDLLALRGRGPRPRCPPVGVRPRRSRPRDRRGRAVGVGVVPEGAGSRCLGPRPDRRPVPTTRHDHRRVCPDLETRIAEVDPSGRPNEAAEHRDALRLGGLLSGSRGVTVRVRRLHGRDFRRYAPSTSSWRRASPSSAGPNEAGKTTIQRALEVALFRRVTAPRWRSRPPAVEFTDRAALDRRRIRAGRRGGPKVGIVEKMFAGTKGTVMLELRRQSIIDPDPDRPGDGRADRHPDGGVLPLDRVRPPLRVRAT